MTTFSVLTPIIPTLNPGPNVTPGVDPLDPEELVFTAAAANQVVPLSNERMTIVFIKNTDNNANHNVTFKHHETVGGGDQSMEVRGTTAGAIKLAGVWLPYRWANRDSTSGAYGGCELTWSQNADMSIAVVHVPYASK